MKKNLGLLPVVGAIVAVVAILVFVFMRVSASVGPEGPSSTPNISRDEMQRQRAAGPPPGDPPLPEHHMPGGN